MRNKKLIIYMLGFKAIDALHLACAEEGNVTLFFTCDDDIIQIAKRCMDKVKVRIMNPVDFFREKK